MNSYSSLNTQSTDNLINISRRNSPDSTTLKSRSTLDNTTTPITKTIPESITNGDYKLVMPDDNQEKRNSLDNKRDSLAYPINSNLNISSSHPSPIDFILNHPALPVMCYCAASILMTVVNKFVVSGRGFSMNFLLLTIQSVVCVTCVFISKRLGLITFRDFDMNDARRWFPISFLLVTVIYTGSKSLQFLSIPVYTIFKNMTIILIAYGEVIWFGGSVTSLTLVSFALMVLSSLTAAYTDISAAFIPVAIGTPVKSNIGYAWMVVNCFVSAGYVLAMRKRIKVTNFRDWDTMFYNNLLSIPVLVFFSLTIEDWSAENLAKNFPVETRQALLFAMCFSGAAAVFISYTTAWCVRTTSSTTFSMVGALNKLPVAASGMLFFGDAVTFPSVSAIFTGFVAGLVYAAAKSAQSAKAKLMASGPLDMSKPR